MILDEKARGLIFLQQFIDIIMSPKFRDRRTVVSRLQKGAPKQGFFPSMAVWKGDKDQEKSV